MTCDSKPCTCDGSESCDLAVTPFEALRVAHGMLLGQDDFQVLMGNPRGKQMLHSAWLHRSGVVWGFDVRLQGKVVLDVSAGLAIDGLGREVATTTRTEIDLRDWDGRHAPEAVDDCRQRTVHACVVAEYECCPTAPVPTLADPCDVERKHDDFSRVQESARIKVRLGRCEHHERLYHRVRVLLGLDRAVDGDQAGAQALAGRRRVGAVPPGERPQALLAEFRCLAALDVAEIRPPTDHDETSRFPLLECDVAAVPLACLRIKVTDADGCTTVDDVAIDRCCRTALLPTSVIQELSCGLAPGVIGATEAEDAGGPRVFVDRITWSTGPDVCTIPVTAALNGGSVRRAVKVTSLSAKVWVDEDVESVQFEPSGATADSAGAIVVKMAVEMPVDRMVRLVIKGTGSTPVYGAEPAVPLAGVVGGSPAGQHDGHDVVHTWNSIKQEV